MRHTKRPNRNFRCINFPILRHSISPTARARRRTAGVRASNRHGVQIGGLALGREARAAAPRPTLVPDRRHYSLDPHADPHLHIQDPHLLRRQPLPLRRHTGLPDFRPPHLLLLSRRMCDKQKTVVRYGGGTILEVIQWKTIKFKIEFSYMSRQIIRPRHAIHCNVHPIHFCQTLVSDADSD